MKQTSKIQLGSEIRYSLQLLRPRKLTEVKIKAHVGELVSDGLLELSALDGDFMRVVVSVGAVGFLRGALDEVVLQDSNGRFSSV